MPPVELQSQRLRQRAPVRESDLRDGAEERHRHQRDLKQKREQENVSCISSPFSYYLFFLLALYVSSLSLSVSDTLLFSSPLMYSRPAAGPNPVSAITSFAVRAR